MFIATAAAIYSLEHGLCTFTCHSPIRELVFNEQIILKKLNKLNISKSPGPDGIHPRVLFELRYELLELLNIV